MYAIGFLIVISIYLGFLFFLPTPETHTETLSDVVALKYNVTPQEARSLVDLAISKDYSESELMWYFDLDPEQFKDVVIYE